MWGVKVASDGKMIQAEPPPPRKHLQDIPGPHSFRVGYGGEAKRTAGSFSGPKITPDNYG